MIKFALELTFNYVLELLATGMFRTAGPYEVSQKVTILKHKECSLVVHIKCNYHRSSSKLYDLNAKVILRWAVCKQS